MSNAVEKTTLAVTLAGLVLAGCGNEKKDGGQTQGQAAYVLGAVVIDADGNRTTYVQTIPSLSAGPFDNRTAIELAGNGVVMAGSKAFYVGLTEEPTWVRYGIDASGAIAETGRLSLLNLGVSAIDYGNTIVDDQTAVSVLSNPPVAVVWNPTTMEITGEVPLTHLVREGYSLEVWTTSTHDGKVYIPGRWADWDGGRIFPGVSMTIIDPKTLTIVGVADDDRCASGGRPIFDAAGNAYVMGDGRNYSIQMFANAAGTAAPDNCLLRIPAGGTDFEAGYFHTIPSLTGGLQSITEIETGAQGSGLGFAKMFYPAQLPDGVEPVDFDFWSVPAHKMWRLHLTEPPTAEEVQGIPFSAIGFEGASVDGHLFTGESTDGGNTTEVFEIDPATNTGASRFTMDGYFYGLFKLAR